jgi:hypothetical protein
MVMAPHGEVAVKKYLDEKGCHYDVRTEEIKERHAHEMHIVLIASLRMWTDVIRPMLKEIALRNYFSFEYHYQVWSTTEMNIRVYMGQ